MSNLETYFWLTARRDDASVLLVRQGGATQQLAKNRFPRRAGVILGYDFVVRRLRTKGYAARLSPCLAPKLPPANCSYYSVTDP